MQGLLLDFVWLVKLNLGVKRYDEKRIGGIEQDIGGGRRALKMYHTGICLNERSKPQKSSRLRGVAAANRTRQLPNVKSQDLPLESPKSVIT